MDIQEALLAKVIHDQAIVSVVNARVTPEFFTDDRHRRVYEYLLNHWRKYSTPPDLNVVAQAFPAYSWPIYSQSVDYFIDKLRERRMMSLFVDALNDCAQLMQGGDPSAAYDIQEIFRETSTKVHLETTPTLDVDFTQRGEAALLRLDDRMFDPGYLRGISTGFKGIDYVTGGLQAEQFVVLIGLPKAMKSSTLLYMATQCHQQAQVPLFIGFEMSNEEQEDRLMSLYGNVGLTKVTNGTLNFKEHKSITSAFKRLSGMRQFITSVDLDSAMTVSGIQAKIMEYRPDVVFIDGAYLMQSELAKAEPGSAQALTDIARALKRLAQNQGVCIVATTQASITKTRGGRLNMFSAMYTQAWGQSADVLLGVERVEMTEDAESDMGEVPIRLKVLASRSGPRSETYLVWDWSKGMVTEMGAAQKVRVDDDA